MSDNLLFSSSMCKLSNDEPVCVLKIKGSVDGITVRQFEIQLDDFHRQNIKYLILIFSEVNYLNSTGMGLLIKYVDQFEEAGGAVKLVNVPGKVKVLFEMLGLMPVLHIYETEELALQAMEQSLKKAQAKEGKKSISPDLLLPSEESAALQAESVPSIEGLPPVGRKNLSDESAPGIPAIPVKPKPVKSAPTNSPSSSQSSVPVAPARPPKNLVVIKKSTSSAKGGSSSSTKAERRSSSAPRRQRTVTEYEETLTDQEVAKLIAPVKESVKKEKSPLRAKKTFSEIRRNSTVRYFRQMNPFCSFPLMAVFSEGKLQEITHKIVAQVEGEQKITVTSERPQIEVVPYLPGCLVIPQSKTVDISPEMSEANFHITPIAEGNFPRACIEIYYQGKVVDIIRTPFSVTKQTIAKIALYFGIASPILSVLFDTLDINLRESLPAIVVALQKIAQIFGGGVSPFGFVLAIGAFITAMSFYWMKMPKQADPVESMFQTQKVE